MIVVESEIWLSYRIEYLLPLKLPAKISDVAHRLDSHVALD